MSTHTPPLSARIHRARLDAGLTQRQLGALVGRHGTSITHYELGRVTPPLPVLSRIAAATGEPLGRLVEDDAG